jgi:hypothetical protein
MNIDLKFNHMQLSLVLLQSLGIRNFKEIEEAFWSCNSISEVRDSDGSIFLLVGFTKMSHALKYAFRIDEEATIHSLAAERATIEEIINGFCLNCK